MAGDSGMSSASRVFVLVITFVAVAGLLIGLMGNLFSANQGSYSSKSNYESIGGVDFKVFKNRWSTEVGYYINNGTDSDGYPNVLDHYDSAHSAAQGMKQFSYSGETSVQAQIVRGNTNYDPLSDAESQVYEDFIIFDKTNGWSARSRYSIDYTNITGYNSSGTRIDNGLWSSGSSVQFLFKLTENPASPELPYTCWLNVTPTVTTQLAFANAVWSNHYTIKLKLQVDLSSPKTSVWTVMGQVLTLQLPETPFVISVLLAVPFWSAIAMAVITIIKAWWIW